LVGLALALAVVFGIALWLNPYDGEGEPRRMETHRQLGLPPCTFYGMTGIPCPSCGMTTSFSLLVRGDVANSLQANAVGTVLALFCMALIPWGIASAVRGRFWFIRSVETAITWTILVFLALLLTRWLVLAGASWIANTGLRGLYPPERATTQVERPLTEESRWHHPGTPGSSHP
jgi:hypothetical protein